MVTSGFLIAGLSKGDDDWWVLNGDESLVAVVDEDRVTMNFENSREWMYLFSVGSVAAIDSSVVASIVIVHEGLVDSSKWWSVHRQWDGEH